MSNMKINDKSTKAQIMEAYNQAMAQLEEYKAMIDNPVDEAKENELNASLLNAEVASKSDVFSDKIVEQYNDLKTAIAYYQKELDDLYGIKAKADSMAAAINAHKKELALMDEERKNKKLALDKEVQEYETNTKEKIREFEKLVERSKKASDEEIAEYKALLLKERNREREEYDYDLKRSMKLDDDKWNEAREKRIKEVEAKEEAVKIRENEVAAKEKEIKEMEEKIASFPEELEKAKEEASKIAKDKAEKSFGFERRYIETEKKHAEEMLNAKIENLTSQVENLTRRNEDLSNKLDLAYDKMKEMATTTVQAGATVKVVSPNEK